MIFRRDWSLKGCLEVFLIKNSDRRKGKKCKKASGKNKKWVWYLWVEWGPQKIKKSWSKEIKRARNLELKLFEGYTKVVSDQKRAPEVFKKSAWSLVKRKGWAFKKVIMILKRVADHGLKKAPFSLKQVSPTRSSKSATEILIVKKLPSCLKKRVGITESEELPLS